MRQRERHYVNLTNGLESLQELIDDGASWSLLRLQSTTIERQDWVKLFLTDVSTATSHTQLLCRRPSRRRMCTT